jgi:ABC-type lipopolysaccharide export system ATPase subunit
VEEAHEQNRHDLLDEIFSLVDPIKIESISALIGYDA